MTEQERWWDSPTFTGQTDDAGNPLFSDEDGPEYVAYGEQEQQAMSDLEKVTATFEIEPVALTILRQQAEWQGLNLEQLIASYVARCARVIENQYGNALVADAFDGLAERNKPKQQRPAPKPEPEPA